MNKKIVFGIIIVLVIIGGIAIYTFSAQPRYLNCCHGEQYKNPPANTDNNKPIINSISPLSGRVGSIVVLRGSFGNNTQAVFERADGKKVILSMRPGMFFEGGGEINNIELIVKSPCEKVQMACDYFEFTPGIYTVYIDSSNNKISNKVQFTVIPGTTERPSITVLSPNGGERLVVNKSNINAVIPVKLTLTNIQGLVLSLLNDAGKTVATMTTDNRDNGKTVNFYVNQTKTTSTIEAGNYWIKACDLSATTCGFSFEYFTITN